MTDVEFSSLFVEQVESLLITVENKKQNLAEKFKK